MYPTGGGSFDAPRLGGSLSLYYMCMYSICAHGSAFGVRCGWLFRVCVWLADCVCVAVRSENRKKNPRAYTSFFAREKKAWKSESDDCGL